MDRDVLVSIVIPIFNVEQYLMECLRSIENQSYRNIEVICVDDSSTDNSSSIVENWIKTSKVKAHLFQHPFNQGLSASRNTGLDHVNGEYVTFIDSDDLITNDFIGELVKNAINSNLDITLAQDIQFQDEDDIRKLFSLLSLQQKLWYKKYNLTENSLYFDIPTIACSKLYKVSYLKNNNFKFISGILHEDEPWSLELFSKTKKIGFAEAGAYLYRQRLGSITANRLNVSRQYAASYITTLNKLFELNKALYKNMYGYDKYIKYNLHFLKMIYWLLKNVKKSTNLNLEARKDIAQDYLNLMEQKFDKVNIWRSVLHYLTRGNEDIEVYKLKTYMLISKLS